MTRTLLEPSDLHGFTEEGLASQSHPSGDAKSAAPDAARTAAFTPGPWVHSRFGSQVLTGDSWSTVCTLKSVACWEDGRGGYAQDYLWQNQEANARLIAAAPDLLEALEEAAKVLTVFRMNVMVEVIGGNTRFEGVPEILAADIAKIRAAIAKATGAGQ